MYVAFDHSQRQPMLLTTQALQTPIHFRLHRMNRTTALTNLPDTSYTMYVAFNPSQLQPKLPTTQAFQPFKPYKHPPTSGSIERVHPIRWAAFPAPAGILGATKGNATRQADDSRVSWSRLCVW
jgi:hypothetical protein